jgi:hypothetical protein
MPFGVANAPSEFMRLMIDLLRQHINDNYCIVSIDDILIYSKDDEVHSCHIKAVLDTICKAGFRLQETKCTFGRTKAPFLGCEIDRDNDSIQMTHEKVNVITNWPDLDTPCEMRNFVILLGVYRRFVLDFARISAPLLSLVTTDQQAFDACCADPT